MADTGSRWAKLSTQLAAVKKRLEPIALRWNATRFPRRNVLYGVGLSIVLCSMAAILLVPESEKPVEEELNWDEFTRISTPRDPGDQQAEFAPGASHSSYLANLSELTTPQSRSSESQTSGMTVPGLNPLAAPPHLQPVQYPETQAVSYQPIFNAPGEEPPPSAPRGAWLTGTIEVLSEPPSALNLPHSSPIFP